MPLNMIYIETTKHTQHNNIIIFRLITKKFFFEKPTYEEIENVTIKFKIRTQ